VQPIIDRISMLCSTLLIPAQGYRRERSIKTHAFARTFRTLCVLMLVIQFLPVVNASEPIVAGVVTHVQGEVIAYRGDSSLALSKGVQLWVGDRIVTGKDARVGLKMSDDAVLLLGANTEFAITAYRYSESANTGTARLRLVKGVLRSITGAIGKLKERDFKLETSVATLGIRGTDFWAGFYFSKALDVALFEGAGVYVENAAGRVEVTKIGDGTTVKAIDVPPIAPIHWGKKKYDAARQSVALEGDSGDG
jgi:hypothetical protein